MSPSSDFCITGTIPEACSWAHASQAALRDSSRPVWARMRTRLLIGFRLLVVLVVRPDCSEQRSNGCVPLLDLRRDFRHRAFYPQEVFDIAVLARQRALGEAFQVKAR